MPFVSTCGCGRSTDNFGGLCDRCVALQSLELTAGATPLQIENSYRTLAKVWHPDRFQHDPKLRVAAEEKLKEINAAHDYLTTNPAQELPKAQSRPQPPPIPDSSTETPIRANPVEDEEPDTAAFDSPDIRRILKRQRRRPSSVPRFLLQAGIVVGAIAMVAILWLVFDAILMSNTKTAGPWEQYKAELGRDLHSTGLRMWSDAKDNLHSQKDANGAADSPTQQAPPVQQPATQPSPAPAEVAAAPSRPAAAGPRHIKVGDAGAQPYVTSGLTPMEVLAILGKPTSSSGEKMFYKDSEIDFRNGQVAGWKVDGRSAPIRVKLWPTVAPTPGLTQFAVGSSKSDVIALQGTPTLFSDNKFGYGGSVVFFQNDRVVSWKQDPNSVRLRVAH